MLIPCKHLWAVAAALSVAHLVQAGDCPCRQQAGLRNVSTFRTVSDELPPAPVPELNGAAPAPHATLPPPPPPPAVAGPSSLPPHGPPVYRSPPGVSHHPLISGYQPNIGTNRWGMMPPPGTLGRTYHRRSTLISDDEHPRTGAVIVKLPEEADISGRGLKVKWTGEEWRLTSEQPLVPGVPHIYAVKAEWDTPTGRVQQVRWVRLIMGRVVDLEF